ncbi:nucleoside phosphorylase domain-containing protein [Aspergillus carlsbadensis]|nr:nucleoside phosphorylase domain-containing protein [Aspergillus carlsbadensis]
MPPEPHEFEFAIVCALPREFDAVEALLDEHYSNIGTLRHHGDSNYYQTGRMGVSNVVVVCLLDMGKASAAGAAASLRSSFPNISLTLVVGICGGVPFPAGSLATEMILGDVVISHQVVKFDSGRQYPDRFERRGVVKETLDRSNWAVLSLLAGLPTREMRGRFGDLHNRFLHGLQKDPVWAYPGVEKDRLFPASCEHKAADGPGSPTDCDSVGCAGPHIPRKRLSGSTNPRPWIHLGPIASGDAVMKSAHHRDRLAREESIVGFEMEGAGVGEVLSSVVIKGVCDYADSHKNKEWQDYAAASGAGCAKALLECLTQTTYERCAVFMSSGIVQKGLAAVTGYSHRSNQPAMGPTAPLRQHGTTQDGLEPAIMHEADAPHREIVTGNQLIQSTPYKTFFGTFYYRAQAIQKRVAVEDESSEHTEIKRTIIFHPASWFRRLGVHYGFNAFANYQRQSWQYGLRPVHVIPDDSLVFRFCETGNVDAVREMLIHGEASIYDADTRGWTLLHVSLPSKRAVLAESQVRVDYSLTRPTRRLPSKRGARNW